MQHRFLITLACLSLLCGSCDDGEPAANNQGRDDRCDDGTSPICDMSEPRCDAGLILAWQDSCYVCVDPGTCLPPVADGCDVDADCTIYERCHPCVTSSCPDCDDCVAACILADCVEETTLTCDQPRPQCEFEDYYAVIRDGCWECITPLACGDL